MKLKFRVYETVTDKDVTDERDWYIDTNGDLCYRVDDMNCTLYEASGKHYYKLEIEVYQ
jgi:hypothetical protein